MNILTLFYLLHSIVSLHSLHPFHVSICELAFNEESKMFEISYRIFTDDFENALGEFCDEQVDLLKDYQSDRVRELIDKYISQHFIIWSDGEKVKLNYLGSEHVNDATWNYFESEEVISLDRTKITNDVLFEVFSDQMNLVHFNKGMEKRSFRFDEDNPEVVF